jgi:hypothetical protein
MANNIELNLGSLDYEDIKLNLRNFLQNQDILKDYNFNGSVINSVISLLAYNTLYYSIYSNMLANEMFLDSAQREESVISLLKPLGVKIPTRTSAMAIIETGGLAAIDKYTLFVGTNSSGINYNFYTLEDYVEAEEGSEFITNIKLYEAKQLIREFEITSAFNYEDQSYFIGNTQIDIETLVVEVDDGSGAWITWTEIDNIGESTENLQQTIYFVERFDTGFEIQFGKENLLGNTIENTYRIRISYLVSSGSAANNIVAFSTDLLESQINVIQPSTGGRNSPDLEYYKFIGPKFFAAQNRAVTKNDFLAISSEYLKSKGYDVSQNNFNVFGGEELFPPKYGRVFVTSDSLPREDILDLVANLKTKCTLSILPEFVESTSRSIFYDIDLVPRNNNLTDSQKTNLIRRVRSYLTREFSYVSSYNIELSNVTEGINETFSSEISDSTINIKFDGTVTANTPSTVLSFENEFGFNVGLTTITEKFTDIFSNIVNLKVFVASNQELDTFIDLRVYEDYPLGEYYNANKNFGRINIKRGILELYNISNLPVLINLNFKNPFFYSSTNVKYTIAPDNIEII